jgi:DNA-binding NarL/FixJ family response regulator
MDLRMPVLDGAGAMVGIRELDAAARIIVLTPSTPIGISRVIDAGPEGIC